MIGLDFGFCMFVSVCSFTYQELSESQYLEARQGISVYQHKQCYTCSQIHAHTFKLRVEFCTFNLIVCAHV